MSPYNQSQSTHNKILILGLLPSQQAITFFTDCFLGWLEKTHQNLNTSKTFSKIWSQPFPYPLSPTIYKFFLGFTSQESLASPFLFHLHYHFLKCALRPRPPFVISYNILPTEVTVHHEKMKIWLYYSLFLCSSLLLHLSPYKLNGIPDLF